MFNSGYLKLFTVKGVRVRAHWTVPLGMLMFSGGRIAPGLWLGILLVIILHELGHAFLVNRVGMANAGIDLTGLGGVCRWVGQPTKKQRAIVAWGGVLAQLLLAAVAWPIVLFAPIPEVAFVQDLLEAFTRANLIIAVFNLIPFGGLDGKEAWPLFGYLWDERKRRKKWERKLDGSGGGKKSEPLNQTLGEALRDADERKRGG